jgi:protein O-mannosyl-transferase
LLFAWVYFCIALVPVMGFTDVGFMRFSLVADHYQHIAIIGPLAVIAAGWWNWRFHASGLAKQAIMFVAAGVLVALACLTWAQSALYENARTIYEAALKKNPGCWLLHGNLGDALLDDGETAAAVVELNKALSLNPKSVDAHFNLGKAEAKLKHFADAISQFQEALQRNPAQFDVYHELAMVYLQIGKSDDALATADKAIEQAKKQGRTELAEQIENWKNQYRQHTSRGLTVPFFAPTPKRVIIEH